MHDRAGLSLLIRAIPRTAGNGEGSVVVSQLGLYDEPAAWEALIAAAWVGDSRTVSRVLGALSPSMFGDPAIAAHVHTLMTGLADSAKINSRGVFPTQYAPAIARLRLIELAPVLIDRLPPRTRQRGR